MRIDLLRPESVTLALAFTLALSLTVPGYGDDATPARAEPAARPAPTAPEIPRAGAPEGTPPTVARSAVRGGAGRSAP